MDPSKEVCAGCWRTLDEIAGWRDMSDPEREAVLIAVAARRSVESFPVKA